MLIKISLENNKVVRDFLEQKNIQYSNILKEALEPGIIFNIHIELSINIMVELAIAIQLYLLEKKKESTNITINNKIINISIHDSKSEIEHKLK